MADSMTLATGSGLEMSVRCEPPSNVVTFEPARRAIFISDAGVMIRSPVLMKNQEGMVFHAAYLEGVLRAAVEAARCEAQRSVACCTGRLLAKFFRKTPFLR